MSRVLVLVWLIGLGLVDSYKNIRTADILQWHHSPKVNAAIQSLERSVNYSRVGLGYDIHRVVSPEEGGKKLILGGVDVPGDSIRVLAHSDGDVVLHSISDAVLGALGKGDIGDYFPDTNPQFEDLDSVKILRKALKIAEEMGYFLVNVDVCILLEYPKLGPIKSQIKGNLQNLLGHGTVVNVKAKTNEKLDSIGKGSAIACHAVVLLQNL
ncbi:2-C-methyl-D-erythritol 2,4-cyclodiphosphate synthase, chloroplast precursor, putative [Theileria annulata]|uniref:2-C-methyl-D-erythritol 2,4-cyclodiphosphate synthase n=1 Tax=Theileria annulata TaxID=5874 RepID=Q4UC75_THEAN|nr:2-C-methyl-D-erythritol 2,4-cyclodiphosphate synthase, chloroplast precursor, putative [Theileria annulata]CAI75576.1 2-C-methyl-D-erythritol 2,4-cyclodiphosphate synthase, chloroplast precursor, putative [Theileria annulata]|eukprot:XP_955052.1 2-C-methyl-D-erythritol 2,4-cyclodiphosphate synthase, chloroplast precursor, putative [Theileria annulata]